MTAPELEYVFTIIAEIAKPRSAGSSPLGERLHIPITGGVIEGPKLQGRVLPGGSDWPLITPDGNTKISAHYTIETHDGVLIYVQNQGIRVSTAEALARVRNGEALSSEEFYMFAAPQFDTPDGQHQWLRERLFVSQVTPGTTQVKVKVYQVK